MFENSRIEELGEDPTWERRSKSFQVKYDQIVSEKPDPVSQQATLSEAIQALECLTEFFENYGNRPGLKFLSVDFRSVEMRLTPKLNKLHSESVSKIQFLDAYQYKFPF